MQNKEIWKDIKGYEGMYQVSNLGRVKSLERYRKNNGGSETLMPEKILKQGKLKRGYCRVELCKDAIRKPYLVHRLVAETFIDNPNNLPEINHKDECKENNIVDNLEWCDSKYNNNYGTHNQKVSVAKGRKVKAYDFDGKLVMEFHSISEAHRQTGISQQCISFCIAGKYKHAGGYVWKDAIEIVKGGVDNE